MAERQKRDVLVQYVRLFKENIGIQIYLKLAVFNFSSIIDMKHSHGMDGGMDGINIRLLNTNH